VRLFVAIDFPDWLKRELELITQSLRREADSGNYVPVENFHLTLAFIGETERVFEARQALERGLAHYRNRPPEERRLMPSSVIAASELQSPTPPMREEIGGRADNDGRGALVGVSPKEHLVSQSQSLGACLDFCLQGVGSFKDRRGHTWWVGVDADGTARLAVLAKDLICALRQAGFDIEHRKFKPHITLGRKVSASRPVALLLPQPPLGACAEVVCLMRSEHRDGRQVYTELASWPVV